MFFIYRARKNPLIYPLSAPLSEKPVINITVSYVIHNNVRYLSNIK